MTATTPTTMPDEATAAACPHGRARTPAGAHYDVRTDCRLCYLADRGRLDPAAVRPAGGTPRTRPGAAPPAAREPDPPPGPGAELKAIYRGLGLPADGCGGCAALARQMDGWGVAGCRVPANRDAALKQVRARAKGLQWRAKLAAAVKTAAQEPGLVAEIVRTGDPAAVFYDAAVDRAAAKGGKYPDAPDVLPTTPVPSGGADEPLTGDDGERQDDVRPGPAGGGGDGAGGNGGGEVRLGDGAPPDGGDDHGRPVRSPVGAGDGPGAVVPDGPEPGRDGDGGAGGPATAVGGIPEGPDRDGDGGPGVVAEPEPVAVSASPAPRSVPRGRALRWAYGVTAVPSRRADLLPRTVRSLAAAGFDRPWLFVDGCDDLQGWRREYGLEADREVSPAHGVRAAGVTCRYPLVRAYANWMLALAELYARDPVAERFALFQDDAVFVRGLRAYLEAVPWPERGYLNLHLNVHSEDPKAYQGNRYRDQFGRQRPEFFDNTAFVGFTPGDQTGQGAMGLVFDRPTVRALLTSPYGVERPLTFRQERGMPAKGAADERVDLCPRGFRLIDAAVIDTLKPLGYVEHVHHPSLVQHVGDVSTIDRRDVAAYDPNFPRKRWPGSARGRTFPGEGFDATTWVTG